MSQHADNYPPSSAGRYVNCPGSVDVVKLYPNTQNDASKKGDVVHRMLEDAVLFGISPKSDDPDADEHVQVIIDYVANRRRQGWIVYAEQKLDIPETGEWGTADLTFVHPKSLEIADYKNGYVLVEVRDKEGALNEQLMTYLLGAIAKYGEREDYGITVIQPNASHIDGMIRSEIISNTDVEAFRTLTMCAVGSRDFVAGRWCKKSYCPHRGACATFLPYAIENPLDAWYPDELNSITDEAMGKALDRSDVLHGTRDELRKAAIRRIMQMDRQIPGYKMVKGKRDREFISEIAVIASLRELFNAQDADIYASYDFTTRSYKLRTVKGIEDYVKIQCRDLGRGKWKAVWEEHFQPYVREHVSGLTLERATDARPAHTRGSELGSLMPAPYTGQTVSI